VPEPRIEKARVFVYSKRKHKNLSKRSESLIFPLGIILPSCNLIICYYLRFFLVPLFLLILGLLTDKLSFFSSSLCLIFSLSLEFWKWVFFFLDFQVL
jgi:type II secretory pathway component PulF